uniref:Uncharacterized protein n=1 Tax=Anguilla anguilla TaxID=7936 RepID=A0A0E9WJV7_ANGAN
MCANNTHTHSTYSPPFQGIIIFGTNGVTGVSDQPCVFSCFLSSSIRQ